MSLYRTKRYPELEEDYELQETLGSGGFAKVKAAIHRMTGEKVAVKIMDKKQLGADLPRVFREIKVLKKLHHQHICQLFQVIETDRMIYMVLEFCPGGELFDYIVAKERLKEREARSFFRQILAALQYVHECGLIHRDLKPENLLLDDDSNIKLIDFGLVAEPTDTQDLLQTCCGSPAYAAPELIRGGPYIGTKADVWSLGVLLYALLNGFLPFDDDHTPFLYKLIQKGEYEITPWLTASSIAMIARLLQTDPQRRITVEKLLHHPWVMEGYRTPVDWKSKIHLSDIDMECIAELAHYHGKSVPEMTGEIMKWNYDEVTATYLLLLQQKHSGKSPHIRLPPKLKFSLTTISSPGSSSLSPLAKASFSALNGDEFTLSAELKEVITDESGLASSSSSSVEDAFQNPSSSFDEPSFNPQIYSSSVPSTTINYISGEHERGIIPIPTVDEPEPPLQPSYREHRRVSLGQPMHPPDGEIVSLKKKPAHPAIAFIKDEGQVVEAVSASPTPRSQTPVHPPLGSVYSTPISTSTSTHFREKAGTVPKEGGVKKTRSFDSRLNRLITFPEAPMRAPLTPTMGRHKMPTHRSRLGSVEGFFKRAKLVFKKTESGDHGPRKIKGVYDVSSTSLKPAHEVLAELEKVLQQMSVSYRRKNYILRCKVPSYKSSTKMKMIEFNLEVCLLPQVEMMGVRRKRLKGDIWEYKRICDQIFKSTKL